MADTLPDSSITHTQRYNTSNATEPSIYRESTRHHDPFSPDPLAGDHNHQHTTTTTLTGDQQGPITKEKMINKAKHVKDKIMGHDEDSDDRDNSNHQKEVMFDPTTVGHHRGNQPTARGLHASAADAHHKPSSTKQKVGQRAYAKNQEAMTKTGISYHEPNTGHIHTKKEDDRRHEIDTQNSRTDRGNHEHNRLHDHSKSDETHEGAVPNKMDAHFDPQHPMQLSNEPNPLYGDEEPSKIKQIGQKVKHSVKKVLGKEDEYPTHADKTTAREPTPVNANGAMESQTHP